jgi:hypothetical protein
MSPQDAEPQPSLIFFILKTSFFEKSREIPKSLKSPLFAHMSRSLLLVKQKQLCKGHHFICPLVHLLQRGVRGDFASISDFFSGLTTKMLDIFLITV